MIGSGTVVRIFSHAGMWNTTQNSVFNAFFNSALQLLHKTWVYQHTVCVYALDPMQGKTI
jgi:hypothetical protein